MKTHWKIIALVALALFVYAVYSAKTQLAMVAAGLVTALSFILAPISIGLRIFLWLIGTYFVNYALGFIPGSQKWYDAFPRSSNTTQMSLTH